MQIQRVEEVQGYYGPFYLAERVIQKIWLRQDLDASTLKTTSGESVEVLHPGHWNLLGGPDFKEARLLINGCELNGDIEIHFYESDWWAHGHERNPAFDRVVLHVYLYPTVGEPCPARTRSGQTPNSIVLLPCLNRDLEDYVIDDALRQLEGVDELDWLAEYIALPLDYRRELIHQLAQTRWERKQVAARKRLSTADWETCCHQLCLEVLGYARNRMPMARLALQYPIDRFRKGQLVADDLFASQKDRWKLDGLRPANHPLNRLEQYLRLIELAPDWPSRLSGALESLPELGEACQTKLFRRQQSLPDIVRTLWEEVFMGAFGETRFHTMMVDAFLPMAAACLNKDTFAYWYHWYPGDAPDSIRRLLKQLSLIDTEQPYCNGLIQGALGLAIKHGK